MILLTSDAPIKQIAAQAGIPNTCVFVRTFHATVGISPGKFRARCAPEDLANAIEDARRLGIPADLLPQTEAGLPHAEMDTNANAVHVGLSAPESPSLHP